MNPIKNASEISRSGQTFHKIPFYTPTAVIECTNHHFCHQLMPTLQCFPSALLTPHIPNDHLACSIEQSTMINKYSQYYMTKIYKLQKAL